VLITILLNPDWGWMSNYNLKETNSFIPMQTMKTGRYFFWIF